MAMDAVTEKALESLNQDVLPRLMQAIDSLREKDLNTRKTDPDFDFLIAEAIELLQLCQIWSQKQQETAEKPSNAAMSDVEAQRLLALMDGQPIQDKEPKKEEQAAIDDNEARRLLAMMDSKATQASSQAEIDDAQAQEMLAKMDAPAASSETDKSVGEQESVSGNTSKSAGEFEEEVEEINEFGASEFRDDPDMLRDFVSNTDELMETLNEQILMLEQNPKEQEIIEEIFRAAHTLKGAAGMFAFSAIERVMHRMENFFDQVRKKKLLATSGAIDVILQALDVLKSLLSGAKENKPSGTKTAPIVRSLNQLCAGKAPIGKSKKAESPAESQQGDEAHHDGEDVKSDHAGANKKKVEQSTIKVDLKRLDALVNLIGELVIDRTRFVNIEEHLRTSGPNPNLAGEMSETVQLFGRHMNEIQDIIMKVRMVPVGYAFNKFPRVVRDLARSLQKDIELVIAGETTELDKTLVEQIGDPLVHLIRNAVDHGIEMPDDRIAKGKNSKGRVLLGAKQEGNQITITIQDDGKGMDAEVLRKKGIEKGLISEGDNLTDRDLFNLIFEPGFSTAAKVTNLSGRGVGMDVVKKQISKLKGLIDIKSAVNQGSTITIQLPLTLAIVQSLLVQTKEEVFAIPLSAVVESLRIRPQEIQNIGDVEVIKRRNMVLPLLYLHDALDLKKKDSDYWYRMEANDGAQMGRSKKKRDDRLFVVVVGNAERRFGIVVDTLLNQQEMVIKSMGGLMQNIPCVAGGAILGNGEVVLVLDIAELESNFRSRLRQQQQIQQVI